MVNVDDAVIAKYKKGNLVFEILVDCENAFKLKHGEIIDMSDVLASDKIFSDSKKGLLASEKDIQNVFSTNNPIDVAKQIIKDGEVQLTSEHRAKIVEKKRSKILEYIRKNGIDPKSGLPHPLQRLELAFNEAKVRIDEHKPELKQVDEIMKKLRPILPIKFAKKEIALKIPGTYAGKSNPVIRNFGKLLREDWQNDGSWICVIEIPAGMQEDLFDKLNSLTKGNVETKILKIIE